MSGSEPGGEGGPSTEIARIEQTMRERPAEYFRDEGMQGRYTDLLTARERHTAAPARTSTAAAREISAIETTMRTNAAAYWKSPEMQERYVALIALRDGSAAPAGKTVIGTQRTPQSPQAMLAEHDRLAELALVTPKPVIKSTPKAAPSPPAKVRPVDAYTAMLARNDALRAAQSPVADGDTGVSGHQFSPFLQRATEAEARVRMPAALVEEWSKGDFTYWGGRPERAKTYGKKREHSPDSGGSGLTRGEYVLSPTQGGGLLRAIMACNPHWTQYRLLRGCIARNKRGV